MKKEPVKEEPLKKEPVKEEPMKKEPVSLGRESVDLGSLVPAVFPRRRFLVPA